MRACVLVFAISVIVIADLSKIKEYDIVYPILNKPSGLKKTLQSLSDGIPVGITYSFSALGRDFRLELTESDFLAENYKEIRIGEKQEVTYLKAKSDVPLACFYEGQVAGDPDSTVTLSTCNGLEGLITTQDLTLVIEPLKNHEDNLTHMSPKWIEPEGDELTETSPHIVYQYQELNEEGWFNCGVRQSANDIKILHEGDTKRQPKELESVASRTVQVLIINDKARFDSLGSGVEADSTKIFNMVAQLYRSASFGSSMRLSFAGQLTFTKGDPYQPPQTGTGVRVLGSDGLLTMFNNYRKTMARSLPRHDVAVLFSRRKFQENILGLAEVGSMCTSDSGVIAELKYDLVRNAVIVAHEMGHTLGMQHDGTGNQCPRSGFIMAPASSADTSFSTCSINYARSFFASKPSCLAGGPSAIESDCESIDSDGRCAKAGVTKVESDSRQKLTIILSAVGLLVAVLTLTVSSLIMWRWWIGSRKVVSKDEIELKAPPKNPANSSSPAMEIPSIDAPSEPKVTRRSSLTHLSPTPTMDDATEPKAPSL